MGLSSVRGWLSVGRDSLRTELWPLPAIGVALAVVLGAGLPQLDADIDAQLPDRVSAYLFGGGASAARTVLSTIASSLVTVTSLTFSLTVVTLQLASGQFSPRLLRTFSRDRFVHVTLALFLATFTFSLTVLRTVRAADEDQEVFVPQISVTVAFVLALASLFALVLFLAHLAQEIRVETMLKNVHADASRTIARVVPRRGAEGFSRHDLPASAANRMQLPAAESGFLVTVDEDALLAAAVEAKAVVVVQSQPGTSLVAGTPVASAWPLDGSAFDEDTGSRLRRRVAASIFTGFERTDAQDIGFGLRQLTDVATKALSPGINDPTTAVHALSHSAALLCELAGHELGPRLLRDEHGRIRVVLHRPDLGDLLDVAVAQPLRYGAADPAVLTRIATLLRELAWCTPPDQRRSITAQLERLRAVIDREELSVAEADALRILAEQVEQAQAGRWQD